MRSRENPLHRARTLYEQRVTPQRTQEMRGHLVNSAAETSALAATAALCEYLNRWNDAGLAEMERAEKAIEHAFAHHPEFFLAHYAKSFLHHARGEHEQALAAFEQTIKAAPEFARAHAQKGEQLVYLGRPREGIAEVERSLEINPNSTVRGYFHRVVGRALFFLEQDADAIPRLRQSVREWPEVWYNRLYLVSALAHAGQQVPATRALRAFHTRFPGYMLARVIENEGATPGDHEFVVAGRERFHEGLRRAGMAS